jgi:hypothetical protein
MGQLWNKPMRGVLTVMAVTWLSGCTAAMKPNTSFNIEDFVSSVTDASGTVQATLVHGDPPAVAGGPAATVNGVAVMINGGSSQQTVGAGTGFTHVILAVEGLTNYYDLTVPTSVASQGILISANPNAYATNLVFLYAVEDGQGVGAYARQQMRFLQVGTGDIQISVSWSDTADVDLHVIDPNNEEIYWSHRNAASGGTLDLDANAACTMNTLPDHTQAYLSNENVVWPESKAIPGTYKVILDYWSNCNTSKTDWVVTIQRKNAAPQVFTGTFVGPSTSVPDDTVNVFTY